MANEIQEYEKCCLGAFGFEKSAIVIEHCSLLTVSLLLEVCWKHQQFVKSHQEDVQGKKKKKIRQEPLR